MPGLAGRISTFTKAKISHLLDNAEDPAETLDYAYNQQMEDLQKVKSGIADVVTAKKRLQLQETQLKEQVDKLDSQARQAMSAGKEDLARTALERKTLIVGEVTSLDKQVSDLESQQQQLIDSERNLQTKIEQFRSKKEVIKAQYSASEAQVQISEAANGIGDHMADLGEAMQRAIDKTDNMQARAAAVDELQAAGTFDDLTSLGPPQDDIDRQLDQLGTKSEVDDELAKMRAELNPGAAQPAIGAGDAATPAPAAASGADAPPASEPAASADGETTSP
jgi:phage shock protein A